MFRWGGVGGKTLTFNGTRITEGTHPPSSMWAKVMVPGGPWGYTMHGASFMPVCEESAACTGALKEPKDHFMVCHSL